MEWNLEIRWNEILKNDGMSYILDRMSDSTAGSSGGLLPTSFALRWPWTFILSHLDFELAQGYRLLPSFEKEAVLS